MMKVGLNLFSIRTLIKTEEQFLETAKKLKKMGYDFIQFSGTTYDPEMIKRVSTESGLPVVLTHVALDKILNEPEKLVEEHNSFGCKNIGLGGLNNDIMKDDAVWKETLDKLNVSAEKIAKLGSKFFFHQHHYEAHTFADGTTTFDYMLKNCPFINFTLDSYWIHYSGYSCVDFADKVKGRMECTHLKDYRIYRKVSEDGKTDFSPRFAPCGNGVLDMPNIIKKWKECGTKYFLVEQDDAVGYPDPLEQVEMSVKYLKSLDIE